MVIAFSLMLISAVLMCKAVRGNFTLRGGAVIVIGWIVSVAIGFMALPVGIALLA